MNTDNNQLFPSLLSEEGCLQSGRGGGIESRLTNHDSRFYGAADGRRYTPMRSKHEWTGVTGVIPGAARWPDFGARETQLGQSVHRHEPGSTRQTESDGPKRRREMGFNPRSLLPRRARRRALSRWIMAVRPFIPVIRWALAKSRSFRLMVVRLLKDLTSRRRCV